jgi:isopenicillin N synthase-like dioxygenase
MSTPLTIINTRRLSAAAAGRTQRMAAFLEERTTERDLDEAVEQLRTWGFSCLPLSRALDGAARTGFQAARRLFSLPDAQRQLASWSGHGLWSGYQPVPLGDAAEIDVVERFEMSAADLASSCSGTLAPVLELHAAMGAALDSAMILVASLVAKLAAAGGHGGGDPRWLWLEDHASTVVVNHYPPQADGSIVMKPHRDFGGLTVVLFEPDGGGSLELFAGGRWCPLPARTAACVLVGELLGGWLGCESPLHRVRGSEADRFSLVVFHQPALARDIPLAAGGFVAVGPHIVARQAAYNVLDGRYR